MNPADQNLFITFGCGPGKGVSAGSTLVKKYTESVRDYLQKNGGVLQIPEALEFFKATQVSGSCERRDTLHWLYLDLTKIKTKNIKEKTTTPGESKKLKMQNAMLFMISDK